MLMNVTQTHSNIDKGTAKPIDGVAQVKISDTSKVFFDKRVCVQGALFIDEKNLKFVREASDIFPSGFSCETLIVYRGNRIDDLLFKTTMFRFLELSFLLFAVELHKLRRIMIFHQECYRIFSKTLLTDPEDVQNFVRGTDLVIDTNMQSYINEYRYITLSRKLK